MLAVDKERRKAVKTSLRYVALLFIEKRSLTSLSYWMGFFMLLGCVGTALNLYLPLAILSEKVALILVDYPPWTSFLDSIGDRPILRRDGKVLALLSGPGNSRETATLESSNATWGCLCGN